MKIANVIVDVKASAINQTFDYLVPDKFMHVITPGMRVVIPFGPRKITGFVTGLSDNTEIEHLKEIIDILDITPVLTKELLSLGKWIANETLCLYITAYQAMLPHVLKSVYKKEYVRLTEENLSIELEHLFAEQQSVTDEEVKAKLKSYYPLQKAIEQGDVIVQYFVKSKVTKKYITYIKPDKEVHLLVEARNELPKNAYRQKDVLDYFILHPEPIEQKKLQQLLKTNRQPISTLISKSLLKEERVEHYRNPYNDSSFEQTKNLVLTDEQKQALQPIKDKISNQEHDVFMIHGVTGSGKTEIYLQAIEQVLLKGQEAIVLVPEISLTPQMVTRFKGRFGSQVAVLHSALSAGENYDEWRRIHKKEVKVVVGARSAIFAPFENLGVIIIDEEHEGTYKQEDQPRYHARDVAIWRGNYHQCPVVLGSATPSLETFARAKKGVYSLQTLLKRTNEQPMPQVEIVDMRKELHAGNRTMFSRILKQKIEDRLAKGEQIVLLLNRRGYSTFVMCRDCGYVEQCPNCDISLTYHKNRNNLKCHYCDYEKNMPPICPDCQSENIRYFGTGTQRVEEALNQLIPSAEVIRMDVDTTRRKGAHERLLGKFANQEADILLGTQMIAKGLDYPNVTLVGVLTADSMLHLPDFRSSERTFQLITQVSGRAGRHELPGEVIVQSYTPDHYSITFAGYYDYLSFYNQEMKMRKAFQYPPYVFLVLITVLHENNATAIQAAQTIRTLLFNQVQKDTIILGPSPSPIPRIKNKYRYQCVIKYKKEPELPQLLGNIMEHFRKQMNSDDLQILIDMQPNQLM